MTTLKKRLGAALGALALISGAVPGTVGTAAAVDRGQHLIRGGPYLIKSGPGDISIIAPSDVNGETRITGLEPGSYSVRELEGGEVTTMRVGRDGRLAFVSWEDTKGPDPRAADPRARRALPVVRRWAEQIAFGDGKDATAILAMPGSAVVDGPCDEPPCPFRPRQAGLIDVNASPAEELVSSLTNSPEAARAIVAERNSGGPFKGVVDFARRICPKVAVDFEDASVKFADQTMLVRRGTGSPKNAGFKCARGTGELELFGKKHNYVGHVTLLK